MGDPLHSALSPAVRAWQARGARVRVGPHHVFVVDEAPAEPQASPVVLLHGFPESSYDMRRLLDRLRPRLRVVTLDFLGFGLSDKPERFAYSLMEQADVVEVVLRKLGIRRAHVVAHDMGTSVATELVARRELGLLSFELATLTLTNGSIYLEMAHLTPSQRLLRLPALGAVFARASSFLTFRVQMRRLFVEPVDDAELRDMFALLARDGGTARLPSIIRYLDERVRFAARWTEPLRRLDVPALIAWADEDPVAIAAIGERLAREIPGARHERLARVGHFTPIEAPGLLADGIERLVATAPSSPSEACK